MNATLAWSMPFCLRAMSRIDATMRGFAGSPISSPLDSRTSTIPVAPRIRLIPIAATPSSTGMANWSDASVPIKAMVRPRSAALSSNNTMKAGGSLLRCAASRYPRSPFVLRKFRSATTQLGPSKTAEQASTT